MADKTKSIEDFVKFTCSSEEDARTYLENAGWNTEMALLMYFDDRDERMDTTAANVDADTRGNVQSDTDDTPEAEIPLPFLSTTPEKSSTSRKVPSRSSKSNIMTFSTLKSSSNNDEEEDDEQLYYAGGSQGSGQQIMGNDRRGDVAGEVFRNLRQLVNVGDLELAGPSRESRRKTKFSGTGYRLGQTPDDTKVIEGASSKKSESSRPEIHLRLYRNGFTIGDEPLRLFSNPENRETIQMLLRGEVPVSLIPPGTSDGKVNVQVEDMRHQEFSDSVTPGRYFTGQGHVLGNVVPDVVTNETVSAPAPNPTVVIPNEPAPKSPLQVNETEPLTTVAVRLPSGTRSQVRLNLTHTVEDLRTHLATVHQELNGQLFTFMVNFPPKEVTDEKLSIKDAGLMNSSVNLKVKK